MTTTLVIAGILALAESTSTCVKKHNDDTKKEGAETMNANDENQSAREHGTKSRRSHATSDHLRTLIPGNGLRSVSTRKNEFKNEFNLHVLPGL